MFDITFISLILTRLFFCRLLLGRNLFYHQRDRWLRLYFGSASLYFFCRTYGAFFICCFISGVYTPACAIPSLRDFILQEIRFCLFLNKIQYLAKIVIFFEHKLSINFIAKGSKTVGVIHKLKEIFTVKFTEIYVQEK